jgi:hypothetical protein
MRRVARLVFLLGLLFVVNFVRDRWGSTGEAIVLGAVVIWVAVLGYLDWRQERTIRRAIATLPLDAQIEAIRTDAHVRDAAAGDVFGNERADRMWQFTRIVGPALGLFYLPALYLMVAGRNPHGLITMGLAVLGIFLWRWWARRYITRYQCPRCGARIPAVSLRPVRFVCVPCAITWRL